MSKKTPNPAKADLARARVLVVGDVMLDRYWYGLVDRISPEAPVPVVRVDRQEERLGAAANVACNVVSLGARATLLSVVGQDEAGRKLEELMSGSGIEGHLSRDDDFVTTVKLRVIGRQQQLLRMDFENEPTHELLKAQQSLFDTVLPEHGAVLLSDYGKGGLTHVAKMIKVARAAGKPVLIDPKGSDFSKYKGASVITPNVAELTQVVGSWRTEAELADKAQRLREHLEIEALLVTRSEDGMTLFDERGSLDAPAEARDVFDVTGAGDTVIATLATLVAAGWDLRSAMPVANKAAGIVVGKFGTATVSSEELFA